jgi:diguanylate cyclase (GGDEF)-like protein
MEAPPPKRARRRGLVYVLLTLGLLLGSFPAHRSVWQGTPDLHTLFEAIATVLGLVTGAMALVRYYTKKSGMFLFLGTGFLGGAFLNGYHAMVTSSVFAGHIPSALSAVTPWSGIMARVFMSLLMCASVVTRKREMQRPTASGINESLVYLLVGAWVVVTFVFFALVRVPPPFHSTYPVHRPADFVPGFFFCLAAVGYLWKGSWRTYGFEYWLVFSLILYGLGHAGYMSFYSHRYDTQFFVAHALNILAQIAVLAGLFVSMFSIYKSEASSAIDLYRANQSLATQLDLERRLVCDLKEAEYRATHDFLSGIHNRAAIMGLLEREASRCQRTRRELGLLIADIDHFKTINDTYGHPVGDEVIKQLALRMASALRPYDSIGRFGGEEFLILVPNCTISDATVVAERLRLSVATNKLVIGQLVIPVTVSVGVSTIKGEALDVNLALRTADSALYEAKNKGRNRVECCDPSEHTIVCADARDSAML